MVGLQDALLPASGPGAQHHHHQHNHYHQHHPHLKGLQDSLLRLVSMGLVNFPVSLFLLTQDEGGWTTNIESGVFLGWRQKRVSQRFGSKVCVTRVCQCNDALGAASIHCKRDLSKKNGSIQQLDAKRCFQCCHIGQVTFV